VQLATPQEIAVKQQQAAIASSQFANQPNAAAAAPPAGELAINGTAGAHGLGEPGSGGGSAVAGIPVASPAVPAPTAAGIRSLRIELPQTGQPFMFTKCSMSVTSRFRFGRASCRCTLFKPFKWRGRAWRLCSASWCGNGRAVAMEGGRAQRNTFILTVALALILGSVCSLLIQWRALHDALIVSFPSATVAVIAWLVWKYWPRGSKPAPASPRRQWESRRSWPQPHCCSR
jgi:hypothetical protein